MTYRPEFRCNFCGQTKAADIFGTTGTFSPCQCEAGRAERERQHHVEIERRKRVRSKSRGRVR